MVDARLRRANELEAAINKVLQPCGHQIDRVTTQDGVFEVLSLSERFHGDRQSAGENAELRVAIESLSVLLDDSPIDWRNLFPVLNNTVNAALAKEPPATQPTGDIQSTVDGIVAIGEQVSDDEWAKVGHNLSTDPNGTIALQTEVAMFQHLAEELYAATDEWVENEMDGTAECHECEGRPTSGHKGSCRWRDTLTRAATLLTKDAADE